MKLSKPKLSAICALFILTLLFSSCSFGSNSTIDGVVHSKLLGGTATEDGYFTGTFNSPKKMFYDYKTKQLVPLCNKPDCKHEDHENCAAYMEGEMGVSRGDIVYGGYIYYFLPESVNEVKIVRTNLDNSEQTTIARDEVNFITNIVASDNKIYYVASINIYAEDDEDDVIGGVKGIHCLDLATNKVSVILNKEGNPKRRMAFEGASKEYIYYYEVLDGDKMETGYDEHNKTEYEIPERLEVNLKKLSLKTLEETVITDARDFVFDHTDPCAAYFVRKKGEREFAVLELDYQTGELKELFTTDTQIDFMVSDKDRLLYSKTVDGSFNVNDCIVFDKRTKTSKEVHFTEDGYGGFDCLAEHGDYFIGIIGYADKSAKVMIKKDNFFNGNLEYDLICSSDIDY